MGRNAFVALLWALFGLAPMLRARVVEIPTEGKEWTVTCPGEGNVLYWLLQSKGQALLPKQSLETIVVSKDGSSITFPCLSIQRDAGQHLCVLQGLDDKIHAVPVMLEVAPAPPTDLWEEVYKYKFLAGFSAAFVVAFIFGFIFLLNKYRWRPEDKIPVLSEGHHNPALDVGDDFDTRM
ncbi:uncharacterized protein LOC143041052 [Oratosquilla oratoria]|uniref:uncharacterized protein LOC143041052 n=1 Tax=Oratosquilla oratoria TaxID=337810 RepID=UPI003F76F8EF